MRERHEAAKFLQQRGWSLALGHGEIDQENDFRRKAGVRGEHENWDGGLCLAHGSGDFAASHAGHGEVEDYGLDGLAGEDVEPRRSVERGEDVVASALEEYAADFETHDFVIDTEDEVRVLCHKACGCCGTIFKIYDRPQAGKDDAARRIHGMFAKMGERLG